MLSGLETFLHISSVFFRFLIGNFLSFAFFRFLIGNFLLSSSFCFLPRARFMVSWDFGSRFVEQLDTTCVRVWFGSWIKGDVPHFFHDTNATMMIWKFYAKLVMHAPMWTLKCRNFFGHLMLELMIHFLYFSQPSVSKICSFINSCIHPSLFWVFGKTFTAFILQVYTHFFKNWLWSMNFFKEKLEVISFHKHVVF